VNFGAGTTTANLKSTYGEVSMQYAEREIPPAGSSSAR
jgi:hypothetical protein